MKKANLIPQTNKKDKNNKVKNLIPQRQF